MSSALYVAGNKMCQQRGSHVVFCLSMSSICLAAPRKRAGKSWIGMLDGKKDAIR
jgi:hypothetical protein